MTDNDIVKNFKEIQQRQNSLERKLDDFFGNLHGANKGQIDRIILAADDQFAKRMIDNYPSFESILGKEVAEGFRAQHEGCLYKALVAHEVQAETMLENWERL